MGDASLYMVISGRDRAAPLLIWLHGGPGGAERPLFRLYNAPLEQHFTAVYLDPGFRWRGSGRHTRLHPLRQLLAYYAADHSMDEMRRHMREQRLRGGRHSDSPGTGTNCPGQEAM